MSHFIDRRQNAKGKSTVNRNRFLRRYKSQIKKAVSDAITKRSVEDVNSGESISIPSRDISEPIFHQGKGGLRERVHPGNDQFIPGDRIARPPEGGAGGAGQGDASDSGEGEDDFVFEISKDEYLDLLFEDLELPNLEKSQLAQLVEWENRRAGFVNQGMPSRINVVRSLKQSLARRMAMTAGRKRQLKALEAKLVELEQDPTATQEALKNLRDEIAALQAAIKKVPFIDTFDLRYNNFERVAIPSSRAVMFCLMDVSGSMDQATKDMAKRFYILLYLFLTRTYKHIDVVYIRHHTQAKEVDEHEFFYSQETGGTIVSSALNMMVEIMKKRYPPDQWNVYAAQASDGDNWADDSPTCSKVLAEQILPYVRYYSYIEITHRSHQTLWREYESLAQQYGNFAMQHIQEVGDIYPVFRELFSKQAA
ncbi:YeaH/YhbH family protein [Gallaecimonas mangrovi]|uniref:YeaH/YhbH family protein n=1 Tax=Gallaecimonas mangrovi TaxID=2291597 RepID=UPI000E1FE0C1|nr:YeaH/YhbH family protein [Gallaecimonas mangrovi]